MKMSTLNKILFFFYLALIISGLCALFALSIGLWPMRDFIDTLQLHMWPWLSLVTVLLLVISFKYLFLSIVPPKLQSTLLKNTEMGMIRVSINTLDQIVQKAARSFVDVKDVKTSLVPESDTIRVRVVLYLMPEVNIPTLTQAVQAKVKESIEDTSGIIVREVQVYVENASTPQRAKLD